MVVLLLAACGGGFGENKQHSTPALDSLLADTALMGEAAIAPANETEDILPGSGKPAKLTIKNDLDYSAEFLKKLTYAGLAKNIELADSLLILEQMDTAVFPMDLPKGKWTKFIGVKDKRHVFSLDVARINYTTLDFNLEILKDFKTAEQVIGKADLHPGFVLASEIDEDKLTGTSYPAAEYHFESPNCTLSIRLGNDGGLLKAKLIKQCKSSKYDISLDDCPVLREK